MKIVIALLASASLLFGASAAIAGGHKNKAAKPESAQSAGAQEQKGSMNKPDKEVNADDDDKGNAGKGNEQSQEMRDRSDERKQIQEDYRSDREPGQESAKGDDGKPEKKPWYKFWE